MATAKVHDSEALSGTAETIVAAGVVRAYLMLENDSETAGENIYLNIAGGTAVVGEGMKLPPDGYIEWDGADIAPSQAISAIAENGTPTILITRG